MAPVAQMGLLGPREGWAATCQGLFLTTDGGATWRDITPPNLRKVSCVSDHIGTVAALGRSRLWVSAINVPWLYVGPCGGCVDPPGYGLDSTSDAGRSWRSTGSCSEGGCDFGELSFADPDRGIGLDGYVAMTDDGGRAWTLAGYGITGNLAAVELGPDGRVWGALGERSPPFRGAGGLVTIPVGAGCACRLSTVPVRLPPPANGTTVLDVTLPVFFGRRDAVVGARIAGVAGRAGGETLAVFTTSDDGTSWTAHDGPPASLGRYPDDGQFDLPFVAVTPRDWLVDLGPVLYRTTSAGEQWTKLTPVGRGLDPSIWSISFATPQVGWTIAASQRCMDGLCSYVPQLYATSDGGATWRELDPGGV